MHFSCYVLILSAVGLLGLARFSCSPRLFALLRFRVFVAVLVCPSSYEVSYALDSHCICDLRPCLSQTLFPFAPEFRRVECKWVDDASLGVQYMFLTKRVRAAAAAAETRMRGRQIPEEVVAAAAKWSEPGAFQVVLGSRWLSLVIKLLVFQVREARELGLTGRAASNRACDHSDCDLALRCLRLQCLDIASLASGFLGAACLELQTSELTHVSRARRRRKSSHADVERPLRVGDLARWIGDRSGGAGTFAIIVDIAWKVDVAAVAAAIDTMSWFVLGSGGRTIAWHAGRVHHRCRNLFPPDAPCESVGSVLRVLWDQRQGRAHTSFWSDRALLSAAGVRCVGGDRDEMLVEEVVELLKSTSKYAVAGHSASGTVRAQAIKRNRSEMSRTQWLPRDERDSVRPSELLELEGAGAVQRRRFVDARAKASRPRELPACLANAVDQARVGVHGAGVQPLPPDVVGLHKQQKGATCSVVREATKKWIDSNHGKAWLAERAAMHAAPTAAEAKSAATNASRQNGKATESAEMTEIAKVAVQLGRNGKLQTQCRKCRIAEIAELQKLQKLQKCRNAEIAEIAEIAELQKLQNLQKLQKLQNCRNHRNCRTAGIAEFAEIAEMQKLQKLQNCRQNCRNCRICRNCRTAKIAEIGELQKLQIAELQKLQNCRNCRNLQNLQKCS